MSGKRHAILVAASEFPEDTSLAALRCPEQDVDRLREVLGAAKQGGFDDIHVLKNEPHYKILEKVNRVIKNAERDDMVVFFYSGHGKLDEAGRLYLATSNTNVEVLESTSVPASQIKDYFDVSAAHQLAIVLDCCYSGAIEKSFTKGSVDDQLNLMSGGKGTYVLTASTGLQTAKENEGDDTSVFTKHLINGIVSGDADTDHNGVITLNELYKYAYREVQRDSHQKPMKWDLNVEGELIIAHSGKSHWQEKRAKIRNKLLAMGGDQTIPNSILTAALSLSEKSPADIQPGERDRHELLSRFAEEEMQPGNFVEAWLKAEVVIKSEIKPEPEINSKPAPEPEYKPEPIFKPRPTKQAGLHKTEDDNDVVGQVSIKADAGKEHLICLAIAMGGFLLIIFFAVAADDGTGDVDTLIGAMFLGVIAAGSLLIYTYRKRQKYLPTMVKFQYWGWGVIYFFTFLSMFGELP